MKCSNAAPASSPGRGRGCLWVSQTLPLRPWCDRALASSLFFESGADATGPAAMLPPAGDTMRMRIALIAAGTLAFARRWPTMPARPPPPAQSDPRLSSPIRRQSSPKTNRPEPQAAAVRSSEPPAAHSREAPAGRSREGAAARSSGAAAALSKNCRRTAIASSRKAAVCSPCRFGTA